MMHRMLTSLVLICLLVWVFLGALLWLRQAAFVYYPVKDLLFTPADAGLQYEEVFLATTDGEQLHGWFVPHPGSPRVVLFLHGNGGNISHRLDWLRLFHDLGLSIFTVDYRGYGRSTGQPSEQGTYHDARAAWEWLIGRGHAPADIVLLGESLGGGVASWLATETEPGALILVSTFTSIEDMGRHYYPWLPVRWLARIHYPTLERIGRVRAPILVMHSPDDEIVPYGMSLRLLEAAGPRAAFLELRGGHNDAPWDGVPDFAGRLRAFLDGTEK